MKEYYQNRNKYFQWITFLYVVSSGKFVLGTSVVSTYSHVTPFSNTRCGKVFSGNTGGIFYQPFTQVSENERCVWQIAVPDAKGYTIKLHYFGYNRENVSETEQGIVVTSFSRHRKAYVYYPNTTDTLKISDCNLLIINFYTGVFESETLTYGFVLEYETSFAGKNTPEVAKNSKRYNVGSGLYYLKHPPSGGQNYYSDNELSTFVFLPRNNVVKNGTKNTVVYIKTGIINYNCQDRIKIYFFEIDFVTNKAGWNYQGLICADVDVESFTSHEPILLIFESDDKYSKSYGFHLSYVAG